MKKKESHNSGLKALKILIFRGGALGDLMLTLPAIAALRRRWPKAYIELTGHLQSAGLALTAGLVNRVQSLDSARMALFFQQEMELPPDEIKYVRSFDLIISYLHDPDGTLLGHLEMAGSKNIIAVSPIIKKGHAVEYLFAPVKDIIGEKFIPGVAPKRRTHFIKCVRVSAGPGEQLSAWRADPKECPRILLKWPAAMKAEARRRLETEIGHKRIIVIHPGSGGPAKNWPAEKFAALAKKIRAETDYIPLIIGGEADAKAIAVMRPLLPELNFLVNAPLTDVASILSVSSGYVGNDSGITHLAAALGIPVVAFFGPTDPAVWAPRGSSVTVIESKTRSSESIGAVAVNEAFRAFKETAGLV